MKDAIVIGNGIIGATVSAVLRGQGLDVLTLDDDRKMSGTKPSGGHLKPSWFSFMGKDQYEPAMQLLDDVWGIIKEEFVVRPTKAKTSIYRVDTDVVLKSPKSTAVVVKLDKIHNYPIVYYRKPNQSDIRETRCRLLVVCTGVWAAGLVSDAPVIDFKQGVSFRLLGKLKQPFIKPWAPYKQIVAHQQAENEVWVGDGTAILKKNWDKKRTVACRERCVSSISSASFTKGPVSVLKTITGLRAYCKHKGEPCLLERIGPRTWLATGAGKNGTIAAGWVARRMLDVVS